jgi:predicted metal-binding transcription factor (methanogenesis marker protein 9)
MTKPTIRIYETDGTLIDREMNEDEFAQYEKDQATELVRKAEAEAQATAKAELLERLGITADEAKLLLA